MVKVVIFDLDDTLLWDRKSVETAFHETCKRAAQVVDVDPMVLEEAVRDEARKLYASYETFEFTKLIGINPFEGIWGVFNDEGESFQKMKELMPGYRQDAWTKGLQRLGIEDEALGRELAELFPAERRKHPFVYEETFRVLDALKDTYELVLLTNGSPSLQQTKLEITPEIAPYFSHIVISGGFGVGKPDPSIFEHVLNTCETTADEAIMVGDNLLTDILGASRVGIRSVWINREGDEMTAEHAPTYEIDHLEKLLPILDELK
ncbi:HAD family hydrolase [Sporosarcina sp. HYO08]|uniref:HAD family hydrolase n=1 Tax=Sporosarcina sp. HYO08 TaxID=1759557 RepID=UPI00079842F4|nr:HAD family hydrolase [Sporosarcina sp. HYO08]KXH87072.1 haloacid dehalogenase [Sporosarcina sp. HYO08]